MDYTLHVPRGDCGWHMEMEQVEERGSDKRVNVAVSVYYTVVENYFNSTLLMLWENVKESDWTICEWIKKIYELNYIEVRYSLEHKMRMYV